LFAPHQTEADELEVLLQRVRNVLRLRRNGGEQQLRRVACLAYLIHLLKIAAPGARTRARRRRAVEQRQERRLFRVQRQQIGGVTPQIAQTRGIQIEVGVVVGIGWRGIALEQGLEHMPGAEAAHVEVAYGLHMNGLQLLRETGHFEYIGERAIEHGGLSGHDQQILVVGGIDDVVGKDLSQRGRYGGEQRDLGFVELEPLDEHAIRGEAAAREAVELDRKEIRYAAHPWIRRLGDDDVVASVMSRKVGLGVVDVYAAARIGKDGGVARPETARGFHHGGL